MALGDPINGWRVCWLGGWDRCRVFFVVMVVRKNAADRVTPDAEALLPRPEAFDGPNRRFSDVDWQEFFRRFDPEFA